MYVIIVYIIEGPAIYVKVENNEDFRYVPDQGCYYFKEKDREILVPVNRTSYIVRRLMEESKDE